MVRAYQKPNSSGSTVYWCENCEEWVESYYEESVINVDNCSYWDYNGDSYYDKNDVYYHTLYMCHECSEPMSLDSTPDERQQATWVCGECNGIYDDQEAARECCS